MGLFFFLSFGFGIWEGVFLVFSSPPANIFRANFVFYIPPNLEKADHFDLTNQKYLVFVFLPIMVEWILTIDNCHKISNITWFIKTKQLAKLNISHPSLALYVDCQFLKWQIKCYELYSATSFYQLWRVRFSSCEA